MLLLTGFGTVGDIATTSTSKERSGEHSLLKWAQISWQCAQHGAAATAAAVVAGFKDASDI
jgi:hypothetical protein